MPECHEGPHKGRDLARGAPRWRAAIVAAALGCAGAAQASSGAAAGPAARAARASVDFAVRIPSVLSLRTLGSRQTIEVREGGPVRVADAASFEIRSNLPAYGLRFEITDPDVASVEVEGLDQAVLVPPEGRVVHLDARPGERVLRRTLAYRVLYRAGSRPGPRPMPVAYSLIGE